LRPVHRSRGRDVDRRGVAWWDDQVAERDPFGRLPGENPLEFLGQPSNGTEAAAAEAVAAEAVAAEETATAGRPAFAQPAVAKRPRAAQDVRTPAATSLDPAQVTRIARRVVRTVIVLAVLVVAVGALGLLASGGSDTSDRTPTIAVPVPNLKTPPAGAPSRAAPPPATRPAATPRGLNASSLLTRRKLAPALRRLGTSGLGRLRTLSIRPERVDAQLLTRGGRLRSVQVRADGTINDFGTSGPGFGHLDTIAFARVQPAAPARLVRSAAERLHRPPSQVDYVVLLQLGSSLSWSVFMRDGKHFLADASGRITRRIS
jgi:hypothetical protein